MHRVARGTPHLGGGRVGGGGGLCGGSGGLCLLLLVGFVGDVLQEQRLQLLQLLELLQLCGLGLAVRGVLLLLTQQLLLLL